MWDDVIIDTLTTVAVGVRIDMLSDAVPLTDAVDVLTDVCGDGTFINVDVLIGARVDFGVGAMIDSLPRVFADAIASVVTDVRVDVLTDVSVNAVAAVINTLELTMLVPLTE